MKYVVLFAVLFTCGICNAQGYTGYGSDGYYVPAPGYVAPPMMFVPKDTTRILNNRTGAMLYDNHGYSGRVANYGNSQSLYDRRGHFQGRTNIGSNGQIRFTPVPTPRMPSIPHTHIHYGPHHR